MDRHLPAFFIADSLGLDFLNSIATPVDTVVDWIDSGDGLLSWLAPGPARAPRRARGAQAAGPSR